jgi:hypothetical protein
MPKRNETKVGEIFMTDNEIIKALECCDGTLAGCTECPNYKNRFYCTIEKDALDLINRQKAEIERLKSEAQMADGYADALEERAKAEAIKEFAERLKGYLKEHAWIWCSEVDNLVEEMVGEDNA